MVFFFSFYFLNYWILERSGNKLYMYVEKIWSSKWKWFIHYHYEVYSIQQYVIQFASDMRRVGVFIRALRFPPPIKLTTTTSLNYCWKGCLIPQSITHTVYSLFIHQHQCSSVRHTSVTWQVSEWLLFSTDSAIFQLY